MATEPLGYFRAPVEPIYALNRVVERLNAATSIIDVLSASSGSLFIDDQEILSNISGASANAIGNTLTALFDDILSSMGVG